MLLEMLVPRPDALDGESSLSISGLLVKPLGWVVVKAALWSALCDVPLMLCPHLLVLLGASSCQHWWLGSVEVAADVFDARGEARAQRFLAVLAACFGTQRARNEKCCARCGGRRTGVSESFLCALHFFQHSSSPPSPAPAPPVCFTAASRRVPAPAGFFGAAAQQAAEMAKAKAAEKKGAAAEQLKVKQAVQKAVKMETKKKVRPGRAAGGAATHSGLRCGSQPPSVGRDAWQCSARAHRRACS